MSDSMLLYNVARMYYLEQFGQQQIANIVGVSRPQVSRLLKEARERGVVDIAVHPPYTVSNEALVRNLKEILKLKTVHVVDVNNCLLEDYKERRNMVTLFAANYLSGQFGKMNRVGVGWGASIYNMVLSMNYTNEENSLCFVPLVGNACVTDPCYQTNSIVDRIAEKFKADKRFLNAPAFVGDEKILQYLLQMNGIDEKNNIWKDLDCALFSLGASTGYNKAAREYLQNMNILDKKKTKNYVSDVLGYFLALDEVPENEVKQIHHLAISLEQLKRIPRKICLAYYEEKADGILVASKMGLISELITDSYTALEIIRKQDKYK